MGGTEGRTEPGKDGVRDRQRGERSTNRKAIDEMKERTKKEPETEKKTGTKGYVNID